MTAIWCHHIMNENKEVAQDLWTHYIQNNENIYYWPIITKAKRDNNEAALLELIQCLQSSEAGRRNLDVAYNTLLQIYVRTSRLDKAMEIVQETKNRSGKLNRATLVQLRRSLEAEGRTFPYKVPSKGKKIVL